MSYKINKNTNSFDGDDINLQELFSIVWDRKILVGAITSLAAILSIIYALNLQNIYTSQTLLAPSNSEDSLSSKLGNLSSLGGFAGFSLPSNPASKSQEGIERIKSFEFFSTYFLPNIKLENILAVKSWTPDKDIIIYDKNIFDKSTNAWKSGKPSDQQAFKAYKGIVLISKDKETSYVTISINHQSPIVAKKWVDTIVYQINESMRKIDKESARNSIEFLNETAQTTNLQSIKEAIAKLLENQMQILMLAASNESYVFKVLDSPIVPEDKSGPGRAVICIIGTMLGFTFALLIIFAQYFRKLFKDDSHI
jgi:LPS O-antigen subunit length determinant protein (WzzB/FepE family)